MNTSGDAAEQVVRLSLEGFEVAARLTGTAAKNVGILLLAALKEEGKTQGKARLTNMIRSGKELKVFSLPQQDLKKFTEHAKKYGVLYCVLRDKSSQDPHTPVDIIARAEDASKIQRIVDRFEIGKVDKAQIVAQAQLDQIQRAEKTKEISEKSAGERAVDAAMGKPNPQEEKLPPNPSSAQTAPGHPSRLESPKRKDGRDPNDSAGQSDRTSVREKLRQYQAERKAERKALAREISGEAPAKAAPAGKTKVREQK